MDLKPAVTGSVGASPNPPIAFSKVANSFITKIMLIVLFSFVVIAIIFVVIVVLDVGIYKCFL